MLIAGPCSAETRQQILDTASALRGCGKVIFRAGIWKPRTRPGGFEGVGSPALQWLREVKEKFGMMTATEVGCALHAEKAIEAGIDVLWIGARTSASPFAVSEIARALDGVDIPVLVKNPVCVDSQLWVGAVERLYMGGLRRLGAIHRGFRTGAERVYRNSPMWEIADEFRSILPAVPMLCDPSHMGGQRNMIAPICEQARNKGYNGLIVEVHADPDSAWTDSRQQITPQLFHAICCSK